MRHSLASMMAILVGVAVAQGQSTYPTKFSRALVERADVRRALAYVDESFDRQVTEWIRITEIPAPSGHEAARAAYIKAEFEKLGLPVTIDGIGNVIATRRGAGQRPNVVFAAHMDTVFPDGTDVTVKRRADGTMHAPGVFDNSASVENMLQAARAMHDARIQTNGDVIFVATVQEEIGLEGMYYWVDHNKGVADMPQCITDIYTVPLPDASAPVSAVYNVGGIMTGGNVVNAVPTEVTFTVDLRTVDPQLLQTLDRAIVEKCESAATAHRVQFTREIIQQSEAGGRPEQLSKAREHPIVQTAVDVTKYLGVKMDARQEALPTGSTDSNVGVLRGIPSISIGRARGGETHTLQEWTDIESAKTGTKLIILLAAALTE